MTHRSSGRRSRSRSTFVALRAAEALEPRRLLAAELLADLAPGISVSSGISGDPQSLTDVNGTLFFTAIAPHVGRELFKSDGTAAGTVMVKDLFPGSGSSNPTGLVAINGTLYFRANNGTHGGELWKSDGTAEGTVMIKDIAPGAEDANPWQFTALGDHVYFAADDQVGVVGHGTELWRTDGTAAGTTMVKDINPGRNSSGPIQLAVHAGQLFFTALHTESGRELWVSDGTEAGTRLVKDINPGVPNGGQDSYGGYSYGGHFYFPAADAGSASGANIELWRTDGTEAGTELFMEFTPGSSMSRPKYFKTFNNLLYFVVEGPQGGVWRTDGTEPGTQLVQAGPHQPIITVGAHLYFNSYTALYKSDGAAAGTTQISTGLDMSPLLPVGNTFYFHDGTGFNRSLRKLNTSQTGTTIVTSMPTGAPTLAGGTVFLAGTNTTIGTELWKTNGTSAGTVLIVDLFRGGNGSGAQQFTASGAGVYFVAFGEPFFADAATGATAFVEDIRPGNTSSVPSFLTDVNGRLFFAADPTGSNMGVWRSEGTAANTNAVGGPLLYVPGFAGVYDTFASYNGSLYFGGVNGQVSTPGLYRSGGFGSSFVHPLSWVDHLTPADGKLYFIGNNNALWEHDGTTTQELVNVGFVSSLARAADRFVFVRSFGQLWTSDGTPGGTAMLKQFHTASPLGQLMAVNGVVYFAADDNAGAGRELWRSDGTLAGTYVVKDIGPGGLSGAPHSLVDVGGILYFFVNDHVHGTELWRSDGTAAGTVRVDDFVPGSGDMNPTGAAYADGRIYFAGYQEVIGNEPHRTTPLPAALLTDGTLSVVGGAGDDAFALSLAGGTITVTTGAADETFNFNAADVQRIVVSGAAGDDRLSLTGGDFSPFALTFNGGTGADALDVAAGSVRFDADAGAGSQSLSVSVASGAAVTFGATQHLAALHVEGAATVAQGANAVLVTGALSASGAGYLDLTDNAFVVDYTGASPVASIRALLSSGYAAGAWTGPGIRSSAAAADASRAIGYGEADGLFTSFPATFLGESVDATAVVARYTLSGDANLDRGVTLDDFNRLAANFGGTDRTFAQGDFTYDGIVNLLDFNVLAGRFGQAFDPDAAASSRLSGRSSGDADDETDDLLA